MEDEKKEKMTGGWDPMEDSNKEEVSQRPIVLRLTTTSTHSHTLYCTLLELYAVIKDTYCGKIV